MEFNDRQHVILAWVQEQSHVEVETIARRFGVTTQTIRRDINPLCELGLLRRRYGGVSWPEAKAIRQQTGEENATAGLLAVARCLAADVPEGATISLGSGEAAERAAMALANHHSLRILTNNFKVAAAVSGNADIEVIVSGGQYRHQHHDVVGPEVTGFFSSFTTDIGVVGAYSLDVGQGLLEQDIRDAEVSRAIITNTRQRWLLAESISWETAAACKVASFRYIDRLYTNRLPESARGQLPAHVDIKEAGFPDASVA